MSFRLKYHVHPLPHFKVHSGKSEGKALIKTIAKLLDLFRKKTPDRKSDITDEQLNRLVNEAVKSVIFSKPAPNDPWELLDRKNDVMGLFVRDNPFQLNKVSLIKAKKLINKCESQLLSGKWRD